MKKYIYFIVFFFCLTNSGYAQIEITALQVTTTTNASEGDYYVTTDTTNREYYVGLSNGTLKSLGNVTVNGVNTGDILSWNATNSKWEVSTNTLNNWSLLGNTGTSPATNFMGTTDNNDVVFKANNIEALRIKSTNGQQLLVNEANPFNSHPLVLRANGSDILAFQDNTGAIQWHWNLLGNGLNFVESNVEDYRLFLEKGGNVGVGTGAPSEKLDVNGRLRIRDIQTNAADLNILTTTSNGVVQKKPLLAAEANNQLALGANGGVYQGPTVYVGFFIITTTGNQTITGLPFQPSQITFVAHANIESFGIDEDNGIASNSGNNRNEIGNAFGSMNGFARNNNGTITQGVIYVGGSGASINDISRYSSNTNCIGIRYSNNNGDAFGRTLASLVSFNTTNSFTINVSTRADNVLVFYTAYK